MFQTKQGAYVNLTKDRHDLEMKQQEVAMKRYDAEKQDWEHDYTKQQATVRKHLIEGNPDDKTPDLERVQELALK
jgi:hypothetical protein